MTQRHDRRATLEQRINATLAGAPAGLPVDVSLLPDGYARVHQLEREILRLVRRCNSLIDDDESSAELWNLLRRRAALREELTVLRSRLDTVRALLELPRQY